jgi:hypothetical protein
MTVKARSTARTDARAVSLNAFATVQEHAWHSVIGDKL